jgi:hypothetical protein
MLFVLGEKIKVLNNNSDIFLNNNLGAGWAVGIQLLLLERVSRMQLFLIL